MDRHGGLDVLKALAIIVVVAWHFPPVLPRFPFGYIALFAVPLFFLTSLHLTEAKGSYRRRFVSLGKAYLLFQAVYFVGWLVTGRTAFDIDVVLRGFPVAGAQRVLYFLPALMAVTLVQSLEDRRVNLVFGWGSLVFAEILMIMGQPPQHWSWLAFFPYLLQRSKLPLPLLFSAGLVHDLIMKSLGVSLSAYARPAAVFGAMLVFEYVLKWKVNPPRFVVSLSRNSLWVFGFHPLVGALLAAFLPTYLVLPLTLTALIPIIWLINRSPVPGIVSEPAEVRAAA